MVLPRTSAAGKLPPRLTSFVGRRHATRDSTTCCAGTSRHAGRCRRGGKSRLAEQAAAQVASRFQHGVWLAELAPLSRGEPVPQRSPPRSGSSSDTAWASPRPSWLLPAQAAAARRRQLRTPPRRRGRLVERIVSSSDEVRVLATSREALGIAANRSGRSLRWERRSAGMFAERAIAVRPGSGWTTATWSSWTRSAEVGRPAARLELPPPGASDDMNELVAHLDDRFRLLAHDIAGTGTPPEPAGAIDWSHELLTQPSRVCSRGCRCSRWFRRRSGSRGLRPGPRHPGCRRPRRRLLTSRWSWSRPSATRPASGCWRPSAPTRGAARGQRTAENVRTQARGYYTALAEQAGPGLSGVDEAYWVERLTPTSTTSGPALEWATTGGDVDLALRLVAYFPDFTYWRIGYESATWPSVRWLSRTAGRIRCSRLSALGLHAAPG